jgi:replicative DNA helicase
MADGAAMSTITDVAFVEAPQPDDANPLYDHRAEAACIAAVMLDEGGARGVWRTLAPLLSPHHFHDPRHASMWAALAAIQGRGGSVDVLTLAAELKTSGRLRAVVGVQYLGDVTDFIPTAAHCEAHAGIVRDCHARRVVAAIGERLARAACDPTKAVMHLRDVAIETLRRVDVGGVQKPADAFALVTEMWELFEAVKSGEGPGVLPFHVPTLDHMSGGGVPGAGGMKRGGAYFIAARPGIGKTACCCQIAGATAEAGERVLYVALEPKRVEIMQSIHANRASVNLTKITRTPWLLTQDDINALTTVSSAAAQWPLHVVDAAWFTPPNTVAQVEVAMRALPTPPALVIVDHLLKLDPVGHHKEPHHGTAQVVAGLVSLGKRTGATMLVLCHIGRGVSASGGLFRRPRAEDVAGGDAMNRDADGIIIMHREDKYPTRKESKGDKSLAGVVDLFAPKLRGVEDNTFGRMRFRGEVQRFEAIEDDAPADDAPAGGDDDF